MQLRDEQENKVPIKKQGNGERSATKKIGTLNGKSLSKIVDAILNDLSTAQELANDYSRQLGYKYQKKQVGDEDDNILSNFQIPVAVLREISLDLKFVIKESHPDGCTRDIDKIQAKCDEVAHTAALYLLSSCGDSGVPSKSSNLAEETVAKKILTPEFEKRLETRVSQGLFRLCRSFLMSENDLTRSEIKDTITDKIEDELLKLEEIKDFLEISNFEDGEEVDRVEKRRKELKKLCLDCANSATEAIEIETLIKKVKGIHNTGVIVDIETLQEMPIEAIKSLRITAKYDNHQWTISEAS